MLNPSLKTTGFNWLPEALNLDLNLRVLANWSVSRDQRNLRRLEALEREIDSHLAVSGRRISGSPEDCIRSVAVNRPADLNSPRTEVEGRFARAERIALQVQHAQQLLRVAYNRAWTAFWWYGDAPEFFRYYREAEAHGIGSSQASDFELLTNLWQMLRSCCATGKLDSTECQLAEHTAALTKALNVIGADRTRPNNSLWAKTLPAVR